MKIVRQRDWKDCGICCLASIVKHYKGNVPLELMRMDALVTKDGTSALNLVNASQKYGFAATGVKLDNIDNIDILPAIAHMNLKKGIDHYVVIYKVTKDKVILMDPAKGKVIKSKDEFYEEWSKVILLFYPQRKITLLKTKTSLFSLFINIFKQQKKLVSIIIIISVILTLLIIASSYYFQIMANAINDNLEQLYLKIFVIVFAIITIFKLCLSYIRNYLENHLNKNIDCILNADFLTYLYKLPLNVLSSRTSGEIVTRVKELASIKSLVTDLFVNSFLDFSLMIVAMPFMLNISKELFLVLFLTILLYLSIGLLSSKSIYKKAYRNISYEADFNNVIIEDMQMINSIKNLNIVDNRLKRVENTLTNYLYDGYKFNDYFNKVNGCKDIIYEIGLFIINTLGFYLVMDNSLNIISLVTFNTLLTFFFDPLKNLIDSMPKYNYLQATITKINDFLSIGKEELGKAQRLVNNDIEIKDLRYSYNKNDYILNNVNWHINSGEFVLIDGPSGSGKSTLCKILDKYITSYDGSILIGGIDIKDLSVATIRENIVYVNQQESLYTATIRENIIMNRSISEEEFQKVCHICCVDKVVLNKPLRYETYISNDSGIISGGEKERIILARALLKKMQILILDEALSEVDCKLEREIMHNIRDAYPDMTIIYVTHKKHKNVFDKTLYIGGNYELL